MQRFVKWSIFAGLAWMVFFIILFTGIIKKTSVFREYGCTVEEFSVDPRFECFKKCSFKDEEQYVYENEIVQKQSSIEHLSSDDAMELMQYLNREKVDMTEEQFFDLVDTVDEIVYNKAKKNHGNEPDSPKHKDDDKYPNCDVLEHDTLEWYSPKLCLDAKYGFEDPLCPPESVPCLTGKKWKRKCNLSCPLDYNITVALNVNHIGLVSKSRDLGTDKERYDSYKKEYVVGKQLSCQVIKDVTGKYDVLFLDERMSHKALQWWKWGIFSGSIFLILLTSLGTIVSYLRFKEQQDHDVYAGVGLLRPDND